MRMFDERVEAAARAMWERTPRKDDPTWADLDYGIKEIWRKDARAALAAADAVCCAHPKCPGGSLCCCQADAVVTGTSVETCAWCPSPARGDAWHNDGKLHPSCGQVDHGQGWVPGTADAVVTEEMIAETILKALVFTNENSEVWADGLARDITALFRGGAK